MAAASRKDAMDGDLGPISPICRSGATAVSCSFMLLAHDVLEAGVLGGMLCGGGQGGGEGISGRNTHHG